MLSFIVKVKLFWVFVVLPPEEEPPEEDLTEEDPLHPSEEESDIN